MNKSYLIIIGLIVTGFTTPQESNVELICVKKHKATNTCYFNFKVDGGKYKFVDIGCRNEKKKEELLQKAKEGNLALSKDWKIECPEPKKEKAATPSGF